MTCNCNNNIQDDDTIQFIAGTTVNLSFVFEEDISSYTSVIFTIRKDYSTDPVISKTASITNSNIVDITLTPYETGLFTEFNNNQNSAAYIWGLDILDNANGTQINVFPQVGNAAPLCIVYKHVVEEG